jgi:hypothetical protein
MGSLYFPYTHPKELSFRPTPISSFRPHTDIVISTHTDIVISTPHRYCHFDTTPILSFRAEQDSFIVLRSRETLYLHLGPKARLIPAQGATGVPSERSLLDGVV